MISSTALLVLKKSMVMYTTEELSANVLTLLTACANFQLMREQENPREFA